jgi:hypothetical protein
MADVQPLLTKLMGLFHVSAIPHDCFLMFSFFRYVPSEGAAGLVLKTKRAALRDGDSIIGVVRSTITKHDGRSQGLVAPNVKAQIGMQIELLGKAGLSPSEIE